MIKIKRKKGWELGISYVIGSLGKYLIIKIYRTEFIIEL